MSRSLSPDTPDFTDQPVTRLTAEDGADDQQREEEDPGGPTQAGRDGDER
jgi:hypothetical protein